MIVYNLLKGTSGQATLNSDSSQTLLADFSSLIRLALNYQAILKQWKYFKL